MKKNVTLRGIVVTGVDRDEAVANFVAAAKGEDVSAHIDQENAFIVLSNSQAEDTVFLNPLTGSSRLKPAGESILKQLTFRSESSSDEGLVNAFYTVCSSCYSHVVADDKELAQHCVVCSAELKDLSESEIDALRQDPETAQPQQQIGLLAVASDAKDAIKMFRDLHEGKVEHKVYDCGQGNMVVACATAEIKCSPLTGKELVEVDDVPYVATASAGDEAGITAELFVCSNHDCNTHVVTANSDSVFCPCCASGLMDPDEEDYEDEEEEEEDEDDSVATASDDEDGDDEDDEDSDDDSDEEEEDESYDEDEEDSDSEEEEDESDDDEEEEDDFESESANIVVASSTSVVGVEQTPSNIAAEAAGESMPKVTDNAVQNEPAVTEPQQAAASDVSAPAVTEPAAAVEPAIVEVIKEVPVSQTVIATNLLEMAVTASGELSADDMTFVIANNVNRDTRWLAFHKDTPIATASARTTKHPELFMTQAFGTVVAAAAQNDGVCEALKEYGFTGIAADIAVDTFVKESVEAQVTAQVSEAKASYDRDHNDYADRFSCAASTVARAIDIDYYRDASHPVKARLTTTLNQLGIKNSEDLVNAAFASSSDEYVQLLVDRTKQLMAYDLKVQNDFTEVVASASKTSNALTIGKPVETKAQHVQQPMTSVSNSTIDDSSALIKGALQSLRFKR